MKQKLQSNTAAVGGINESDVNLAEASSGIIVGFNVTSSVKARRLAEQRNVEIRYYDVIYDLIDDLTKALEGLLDPEIKLEVLGHAEVRDVFKISKDRHDCWLLCDRWNNRAASTNTCDSRWNCC